MRVVSLVPSITETLLAWGVDVVACTRFCEQPQLRHVGGTKDPDVDAIVALAPDLVVVDREENRRPDADALAARGVALHVTHVTALADVTPELIALAVAVGVAPPRVELPPARPRWAIAATLIWRRPWMALGAETYGSTLLDHLGVANVVAGGERYPTVELADLAGADLILLPTEPYPFKERHVAEITGALPAADVRIVDGADLLWWGVRTPVALERLRQTVGRR
ncbi:MAG: helical backbone metal receptor [Ilumatobacteraceae bacterium]